MTCQRCNGTGRIMTWSLFGPEAVIPCPDCRKEDPPLEQDGAVRSEGNVRILPAVGPVDIPVKRVLAAAGDADLKQCIVIGEEQDGSFYFASNQANGPDVLWALERAKVALLKAGGAA